MNIPSTVEFLGTLGADFVSSAYEASIEKMY